MSDNTPVPDFPEVPGDDTQFNPRTQTFAIAVDWDSKEIPIHFSTIGINELVRAANKQGFNLTLSEEGAGGGATQRG